jgi:hypothetical protein
MSGKMFGFDHVWMGAGGLSIGRGHVANARCVDAIRQPKDLVIWESMTVAAWK